MKPVVSIVIPTKNSAQFLENCLKSIRKQSCSYIEIIIVDGGSTDKTIFLAKKYKCKIYRYVPKVLKGLFDASYKRNYGINKAKGYYVYWLDADMELPKKIIAEAISVCQTGKDAVILPEDSFGEGIWARAKQLERRFYWGDNTKECPRFFKHSVWNAIDGFDETLGAGGDDLDLFKKLEEHGYSIGRTKEIIMHNEGDLKLSKLFKKHFMYGRDTIKYFYKRPKASIISYFPIRMAYIRNFKLFINHPIDTLFFIIMRSTEYFAGLLGLLYSFVAKN